MSEKFQKNLTNIVNILLLFCCTMDIFAQSIKLPDIGSTADTVLSPQEEKHLGKAFIRSVHQYLKVIDDPVVSGYIQALGNRLVNNIEHNQMEFTFFVVDDPQINAFAGPGGYIGVHSGLILTTETESELASVLAHEIAHVTQRHLQRSFEKAEKLNLTTAAALLAAIIIGTENIRVGEAILAATLAGNTQTQINFTRAHEKEADRVGIQLLLDAGFNPQAMPTFFERLLQKTRYYDNEVPEFLRTHPVTVSRISDSRNRAEQHSFLKEIDSINYHLARSKLTVQNNQSLSDLTKQFEESLKYGKYHNVHAERYGYALALTAKGDYKSARRVIKELIKHDQERIPYLLAQAQIEIQSENLAKAGIYLQNALRIYPHHTPFVLLQAKIFLAMNQINLAIDKLEEHTLIEKDNPALYSLLAQAYEKDGQPAQAHRFLAEAYYHKGQLHQAIEYLQIAQRQKNVNPHLESQIKARIEQLKQQAIREQDLPLDGVEYSTITRG